ncbi:hypothetical protein [Nostoc sp. DSM 114160]
MLAKSTEMRKQSSILRKQYAFLFAESTEMNARYTEMRKQLSILRKQYVFLLAKSTEMRKQYAFLLIKIDSIGYQHFSDKPNNLSFGLGDRFLLLPKLKPYMKLSLHTVTHILLL